MKKNLRVLLVEDSEDDSIIIQRVLSDGGFEPVCARVETSADLVRALEEDSWDIVICDYYLPGFTGFEALEIVKKINASIPFFVVSGHAGEDVIVEMIKAGATNFILKDNLKRLVNLVDREVFREVFVGAGDISAGLDDFHISEMSSESLADELQIQIRERKLAELRLKLSELRHKTLFEQAPNGIFISTPQGRLLDCNLAYAKALGYDTPAETISSIKDIAQDVYANPDERKELIDRITKYNQQVSAETFFKRKDGSRFPVNITLKALPDEMENRPYIIGIMIDISEIKKTRKALSESEERFRMALRNAPLSVFNQDTDLVYTWVYNPNDQSAADQVVGKKDMDLFPAEDAEKLTKMKSSVIASGKPLREEVSIYNLGEKRCYDLSIDPVIDDTGIVAGITSVALDITDRVKAEEALRLSESHYRNLVESANSIIVRWKTDGTFVYVNDYFCKFFGYEEHEVIGRHVNIIVPDTDRAGHDLTTLANDILANPDLYSYNENDNILRTGEIVTISWSNRAITDEYGNICEILAIGNDITGLKRAEEELRQLNDKLELMVQNRTNELEATVDDLVNEISERIKAQEELRVKEEQYRALVEYSPDIVILVNKEFDLIYANKALERETGILLENFIGRKIGDVLPSDLTPVIEECIIRTIEEKRETFTEFSLMVNGVEKCFSNRFAPIFEENGDVVQVLSVVRNITELKAAYKIVETREREFRTLVENSPDIIILIGEEGRYLYVNPSHEKETKFPPEAVLGKNIYEIGIPKNIADPWQSTVLSVFETGRPADIELSFTIGDKENWFYTKFVPITNEYGKIESVLAMTRNITELNIAREEIRKKEEDYRALVENTPDIISVYDKEFRYVFVNSAIEREMGIKPMELTGKTNSELGIEASIVKKWEKNLKWVFRNKTEKTDEFDYSTRDGHRWYYTLFIPIFDKSGRVENVLTISRDITDNKLKELEIIKSRDSLEEMVAKRTEELKITNDNLLKEIDIRKKTEIKLRESEEHFRIALRNSPVIVYNMDKDLKYTWIHNPVLGFTVKDIIGKTDFDLFPDHDSAEKMVEIKRKPFDSGEPVREVYSFEYDGKQYYFDLYAEPVRDENDEITGVACSSYDITNIMEYESAIRESSERFRVALQNAPISVLSQDKDLKVTWHYNSRFGFESSETIGKTDYELFSREDADKLNAIKTEVINTGKPQRKEIDVTLNNRSYYLDITVEPTLDNEGNICGVMTAVIDVTDIRLRENELRIKDAAISSSINGIAIADLSGNLSYVNKACLDMWGYDNPDEVIGKSIKNFIIKDETLSELLGLLESNQGWIGEIPAIRKDGRMMIIQVSANIVTDDKGKPVCMMASLMDTTEKKKMEEAMRESERRYRILFEQAPNGIFLSTIEGRFIDVNPAYARMLGYRTPDEVLRKISDIGKDIYAFPKHRLEIVEKVKENPDFTRAETIYRKRDGTLINVLIILKSIMDSEGNPAYLIGHVEDITELRQAEKNKALLSAIIESSDDAIYSTDLYGVIITWNNAAERMYLYTADEIIGNKIDVIVPEEKMDELYGAFEKIKKGEKISQFETLRNKKDGSTIPVAVLVSPIKDYIQEIIGYSIIARDLTQIRKTEIALRDSMERLRIALQYTPITILTQDTDLRFTWVYHPVMNFDPEELIGKTDYDILSESDAEAMVTIKRRVIETGQPVREEVSVVQAGDGKRFHFDLTVEPIKNDFGKVIGITCATIDITEKKEHEIEKQRQEIAQVLEKSARLASVGVLAGGITHEINQPLNAIRMGSDGILLWNKRNKNVLPDIITDMLLGVSSACKRIEEIILNMRSLWSGLHQENMQTININESAVRSVSMLHQKLSNHGINFEIKLPEESLYILANLLQVELIINNLVVNAIYAVDKARTKGKSIELEIYADVSFVYVEVRDNGFGLPDVPLDKLFDPFFTTKPPEEGSGLGLAIVRMFVNRFEGKVDAFNNEEGGATFQLKFPRKNLMEE